ncbi:MAG: 2-succinyl-6-hydroxy-2,4-cyclohexadiene-1-carboxylate synthase [Deltaproteobacteria bacterium]|nr:2-succinyl-6-hydroxy-2,4-cyclohexadiene-1-carboxylate synthase [Deltaproteobacteria bacterium]
MRKKYIPGVFTFTPTLDLQLNGKKIESVWHGPLPEEAPTLIFLHEGLGSVSMWRDFPQKLSQKTECGALVYSRLGYGKSGELELPRFLNFMHHEAHQALPEILKQSKIQQYILVGHSDGASIALIHAGQDSADNLLGLINEAPHVFCEPLTITSIQKLRENYLSGNMRKSLKKHHLDIDTTFHSWADIWLDPEFAEWNIESSLPGIKVPQLIIQGNDDEYGTSAQVDAIARQAGGSVETCFLDNCGHSPHRDQQSQTLEVMTKFVRNLLVI